MKIAITGASGFLGGSLAQRLHAKGHELYLHARSSEQAELLKSISDKLIICDINDVGKINSLVDGADLVIHTVSNFRSASGPPESYTRINVEGTKNVFNCAKKAKVGRFVHISTIGVLGDIKECPASETTEYNPGDDYQRTKLQAELFCREQAQGGQEMEVVILRPCSIYGPGDLRMLKMFRMLTKGTFFTVGDCSAYFHAVYIDDLLDAIELVLNKEGIDGEVFIVGGENYVSLKEYISTAARSVGAKYPWVRIPYWPMYVLSAVVEFVCVMVGVEPPIFRRRVRFFRNNRAFDISKAQKRLGYTPKVDLLEGMVKTVEWYRSEGYL